MLFYETFDSWKKKVRQFRQKYEAGKTSLNGKKKKNQRIFKFAIMWHLTTNDVRR